MIPAFALRRGKEKNLLEEKEIIGNTGIFTGDKIQLANEIRRNLNHHFLLVLA